MWTIGVTLMETNSLINDGWSKEDIESGLADAFEGDLDARWNKE